MTVNLYWKNAGKIRSLVETPFKSEQELEAYIFANQEILGGDISIIHRQIRTGSKQGIPDMLGIDQDERVCILELKNVVADESILPQALSYATWAETNPDSIKAIWLESKRKPDNLTPNWDNLDIRIILIAPAFKPTVSKLVGKINYPVDLIEIQRYVMEDHEFVLVENVEAAPVQRNSPTKAMGDWNWGYYESEHGADAVAQFRKVVDLISEFAVTQGWNFPFSLTKSYVGFKFGNRLAVEVVWVSYTGRGWNIQLKLPKNDSYHSYKGSSWEFQSYDNGFGFAIFRPLNPENPLIDELKPFLVAAYDYVSGRK